MRKFWTGVARFLAVVCAALFVLTTLLALWLVQVERRTFLPATYKAALAGQQVYARLPRILAEQLVTAGEYNPCQENPLLCEGLSPEFMDCAVRALGEERVIALVEGTQSPLEAEMGPLEACVDQFGTGLSTSAQSLESGMPSFLAALGLQGWETLISTLLPADQLRSASEAVIDQFFAYLNGQRDSVSVSLGSIKTRLAGPAGVEAVLQVLRAQPVCKSEQMDQMEDLLYGRATEAEFCNPGEDVLRQATPHIRSQLDLYLAQIPDEQVLLDAESGENSAQGGQVAGLRFLRWTMRLSPDLALFFLLLVSFLAVRSARGWLRWWGIPSFLAGLASVGLVLSFSSTFEQIWVALLAGRIPGYLALGLVTLLHDLLRAVLTTVLRSVGFASAVLTLVGLGMWIGSYFVRRPPQPEQPPAPAEIPPAA